MDESVIDQATYSELEETAGAEFVAELVDTFLQEAPLMLAELREDNQRFIAAMREARDLCDEHNDVATTSLLEVHIDEAEKRVWFLYEAARRGDPTGQ